MPIPRDPRKIPWYLRYEIGARVATLGRRLLIQATHRHCHVEFQGPVRIGPRFKLDIPDAGTLIIGPGVDFREGFSCSIQGNGRVVIGKGTVFTKDALVQCATSIEIGANCAFGQSVLIVDGYHRYRASEHWLNQGYDFRPIQIGDGAGISDKSTVQADIGERAMIASGSVVNRPIPAYCLAVGRPARVVRYFGPDDRRPTAPEHRPRRRSPDRYMPAEASATVGEED